MIDWQGTTPNLEFELLLKSVEDYVGKPPALKKGTGQENEWQQHWEEEVRRQRKEEEERKERERKVRAEKERIAKEEEAKKEREKQKARQEEIRLRNEQEGKKQTPREKGTDYYRDSKAPIYIAIVIGIIVVSIVTSYTLKFFGFL